MSDGSPRETKRHLKGDGCIMKRRTLDRLASLGGTLVVVVLVVAGSLLMWGASFANSSVHNQLAQQDITFPTAQAFANAKPGTEVTPSMKPYLLKYAGQQVLTGQQAEAYADHFIAVHLTEMPYHGVYSAVSSAARANPKNAKLQGLVTTVFQGTTLRGLLLEAYAFGMFGTIALWAGVSAYILAALMLILVLMGFVHAKKTPETAEI